MIKRQKSVVLFAAATILSISFEGANGQPYATDLGSDARGGVCPSGEGWVKTNEDPPYCFWFSNVKADVSDAKKFCATLNSSLVTFFTFERLEFLKSEVAGDKTYWTLLRKGYGYGSGFYFDMPDGTEAMLPDNLLYNSGSELVSYMNYHRERICVSLTSTGYLTPQDCGDFNYFICEKKVDCGPARFGVNCERECHCAEEQCDKSKLPVMCLYGCQSGWTGEACDTKKQDPTVLYYCFKEDPMNYVHIMVDTHGQEFKSIFIDTSESIVPTLNCDLEPTVENGTKFSINAIPYDMYEIRPYQHFDWMALEDQNKMICPSKVLNHTTFQWKLVVQEYEGVRLDHDLEVEVTCDFSNADSMMRSSNFYARGDRERSHKLTLPSENTNINFQVVSPYSKAIISEASLATPAVLTISYVDSKLTGVMPKNCQASSTNGTEIRNFLDENGCPLDKSPLSAFKMTMDKVAETDWFPLFSLGGDDTVVFTCTFEPCFEGSDSCEVGCRKDQNIGKRSKRDTLEQDHDETEGQDRSMTRTIRVLPSISPNKVQNDRPDSTGSHRSSSGSRKGNGLGYKSDGEIHEHFSGTWIYFNPITCGLFLLLLIVFVAMYVAFLRSLRSSVENIRKEVETKRSREKFIDYGYAVDANGKRIVDI